MTGENAFEPEFRAVRAHRFGDDIDTDIIIPARVLSQRTPEVLRAHCMEPLAPDFAERVSPGDVLVAGRNFGCGSSREHAVLALQACELSCVIARSFARIFFRNSINRAFPLFICPDAVDAITDGQEIAIDLERGRVEVDGKVYQARPLPEFLQGIIRAGGLVQYVRRTLAERAAA